jgi:SET domain-containing protein
MLRVPTIVKPSPIAGVGLFSATDVDEGTVVWEYEEGVDCRLSQDQVEALPEPYQSRIRHYLYLEESGLYVLCGDNAKFMNHQDDPNCADPEGEYTVTRRRIRAGEELTCDYRTFDVESRRHGRPAFGPAHSANGTGKGG